MYVCTCKDLVSGKVFDKHFSSPYFLSKFVKKCKYSKKIKVLAYQTFE